MIAILALYRAGSTLCWCSASGSSRV